MLYMKRTFKEQESRLTCMNSTLILSRVNYEAVVHVSVDLR